MWAALGLHLNEAAGEKEVSSQCLYVLGAAITELGDPDQAVVILEESLLLTRELELLVAQARAYRAHRSAARAATLCEEALQIRHSINYLTEQAETLVELGHALNDLRQTDRGTACWKRALRLYEEVGGPEVAEVQLVLAR